MERTWKKTLAAGIAAVMIVFALVLAGGRLTDHTAPADQGSSAMQQTDADRQQEQTPDPDDPDVVGPKQNGNREVTGSTTGNSGGQDQYHTDPVPKGRPQSVEPGSTAVDTDTRLTCTISISCATILDNMDVLHVDAGLAGKGRTNRRFIQNSLQLSAGIVAHHPRQVFHVDTVRNPFRFQIVGDDLLRIGRRGRLKSDFSVKPSGTAQGARQLADIVCRGDHKHTGVLHIVDPRLHGGIFRRVAVGIILVGKFVHVVQKDNGRRFCLRAGKGLCNSIDKGVAALVAAYRDGVQPALLHKAPRQKCLTQARVAIQQQSMGQAGAPISS